MVSAFAAPAAGSHASLTGLPVLLVAGISQPSLGLQQGQAVSRPHGWIHPRRKGVANLDLPVCLRDVPSAFGFGSCKFISQHLCNTTQRTVKSLTGGWERCLARKRTCALVGSSAHLLSARFGAEIDAHDEVLRVNNAPAGDSSTPELIGHVGARTTARFVNEAATWPRRQDQDRGICLFLHDPKISCGPNCWNRPHMCNLSCPVQAPKVSAQSKICARSCDLDQLFCGTHQHQADHDWGRNYVFLDHVTSGVALRMVKNPTAGFRALAHLLHTCEQVSVYGFGPTCSGEIGKRYYKGGWPVTVTHSYDKELHILGRAVERMEPSTFFEEVEGAEGWIRTKNLTLRFPPCMNNITEPSAMQELLTKLGTGVASLRLRVED